MKAYINAKIYTVDPNNPEADYLIENEGRIVDAGKCYYQCENAKSIAKEDVIDLEGCAVVPGFFESHLHIVDSMRSLVELNLRNLGSLNGLKIALADYASRAGINDWIIGHGWDEKKHFNGSFPDRQLLDLLHKEHPVMLIRMDGHSICLNSKAIEMLNVDSKAPNNEISYDSKGKASGMLFENAANSAVEEIVEGFSEEYIEALVLKAQELLTANGITSVNDICTGYVRYFDIYRKLQKSGKLKIRINAAPYGMSEESIEEFDVRKCDETDTLRIAAPKFFMDGSFGSRTALLMKEYADAPGNFGLQLMEREQLKNIIIQNESLNQPITIHAIGDKAVNIVLDCIEGARINNQRDIRHRIEHIQIVQDSDIKRFRELDVTASFQPVFLYEEELTESRLGRDRFFDIYRFKSFIEKGVNVVFNSDFPYGGGELPYKKDNSRYYGFEPLLGMHAACYRQLNAKESVEPVQALQCYTIKAAYANYREKDLGKLAKGYFADFVVLSQDILKCSPEEFLQTQVLKTVVNGEAVFDIFSANI